MKTQTKTGAAPEAPAAAPSAEVQAAPEAKTGNMSLDQLATMYSKPRKTAAASGQKAEPGQAPQEMQNAERRTQNAEEPQNAEANDEANGEQTAEHAEEQTTENAENAESTEGERTQETEEAASGAPGEEQPEPVELTAEEQDAMTDAEFAQYVANLTKDQAQRKMLQRIHRLTARLKAQERGPQVNQTQTQENGQNTRDDGQTQRTANQFKGNPLIQGIERDLALANEVIAFADENPNGGEYVDPKTGAKRELSGEQLRVMRRNAEAHRTELVAERATTMQGLRQAFAATQQNAEAAFQQSYPNLSQEDHPDAQVFAAMAAQVPDLAERFPDWKLWLGWAVEGRRAWEARQQAATNGKNGKAKPGQPMVKPKPGSREPARVVAQPASQAPRANPAQKAVQEAQGKFAKSGKLQDLAVMFSRTRAMRAEARRQ